MEPTFRHWSRSRLTALAIGAGLIMSGCGSGSQVESDFRSVGSEVEVNTDFVPLDEEGENQQVTTVFVLSNRSNDGLAVEMTRDSGHGEGGFFGACLVSVIRLQKESPDGWDIRLYAAQDDRPLPPDAVPLLELSSRQPDLGPTASGVRQIDVAITDQGAEIVSNRIVDPAAAPDEIFEPIPDCPAP